MPTINLKYIFYGFVLLITVLVVWHFYDLEKNKIKSDFVVEQTKVVADEKAKDEAATDKLETQRIVTVSARPKRLTLGLSLAES